MTLCDMAIRGWWHTFVIAALSPTSTYRGPH
jgi:hypothetical protein